MAIEQAATSVPIALDPATMLNRDGEVSTLAPVTHLFVDEVDDAGEVARLVSRRVCPARDVDHGDLVHHEALCHGAGEVVVVGNASQCRVQVDLERRFREAALYCRVGEDGPSPMKVGTRLLITRRA
ncbi:hypothetical protein ACN24K_14405 [Streptomyces microflavus]